MSRKGLLWRGELATHMQEYLEGGSSFEELLDWSLDHPFFNNQEELEPDERALIASALGHILQHAQSEPPASRTNRAQLRAAMRSLWGGPGPFCSPVE